MELNERIRIAYKKLKSSVYFDKTQMVLRNRIVAYETGDFEEKLENISQVLLASQEDWVKWEQHVLDSVGTLLFPKKLLNNNKSIIFNVDDEKIAIKEPQYFIDLDVEGQILGILWVLTFGRKLDDEMYDHSYGNRLRKTLINSESKDITYSPYLYQPYFSQYESWRDQGLDYAKSCLDAKQDAIILTLDFKSFFYSVHMDEKDFKSFLHYSDVSGELWAQRVNNFVFHVIERHASLFSERYKKRNFLPIGFFPSNILANWRLDSFDKQLINRWNPVYYGRYVDDIIIVDKVEKNSLLYAKTREGQLKKDDVIRYYFCNCNAVKEENCCCNENRELFIIAKDNAHHDEYKVSPALIESLQSDVRPVRQPPGPASQTGV